MGKYGRFLISYSFSPFPSIPSLFTVNVIGFVTSFVSEYSYNSEAAAVVIIPTIKGGQGACQISNFKHFSIKDVGFYLGILP